MWPWSLKFLNKGCSVHTCMPGQAKVSFPFSVPRFCTPCMPLAALLEIFLKALPPLLPTRPLDSTPVEKATVGKMIGQENPSVFLLERGFTKLLFPVAESTVECGGGGRQGHNSWLSHCHARDFCPPSG